MTKNDTNTADSDCWVPVEYQNRTFEVRQLSDDALISLLSGRWEDIDGKLIRDVESGTNSE